MLWREEQINLEVIGAKSPIKVAFVKNSSVVMLDFLPNIESNLCIPAKP